MAYKTIAETKNFIVLDKYTKISEIREAPASYQTESSLEREFIADLQNQGYEFARSIKSPETMLADVRPQFKSIETEQDEKKLTAAENKEALLHPDRIKEISHYILNNFKQKTHRLKAGNRGFNAMFAVSSIDAAKRYYESLTHLQKESDKPLKVATIFSFAANEEQDAVGAIPDYPFYR